MKYLKTLFGFVLLNSALRADESSHTVDVQMIRKLVTGYSVYTIENNMDSDIFTPEKVRINYHRDSIILEAIREPRKNEALRHYYGFGVPPMLDISPNAKYLDSIYLGDSLSQDHFSIFIRVYYRLFDRSDSNNFPINERSFRRFEKDNSILIEAKEVKKLKKD